MKRKILVKIKIMNSGNIVNYYVLAKDLGTAECMALLDAGKDFPTAYVRVETSYFIF